mgnify:CR=1 FL=1
MQTDADLGSQFIVYETEPATGYIVSGSYTGTIPTTASKFALGATVTDRSTGIVYRNSGTVASPSWQNTDSISSSEIADGTVTRADMSASAGLTSIQTKLGDIATTGTFDTYVRVSKTGTISAITMMLDSNLSTSDTNYITFTATNLTGTKVLLNAAGANNTTTVVEGSTLRHNIQLIPAGTNTATNVGKTIKTWDASGNTSTLDLSVGAWLPAST